MATDDATRRLTRFVIALDERKADELEALTDAALTAYVVLSLTFRERWPEAYDRWRLRITLEGLAAEDADPPSSPPH